MARGNHPGVVVLAIHPNVDKIVVPILNEHLKRLQGPTISEKLNSAFFVENGEIKDPVTDAMIPGSVHAFLKGICGIGSGPIIEFGRQSRPIEVREMTISGSK